MGGPSTSYTLSIYTPSTMLVPTNTFIIVNPPLSFGVPSRGSRFHSMGNPQHGVPSFGVNVYNHYHVASVGMVPLQPFMNQLRGGYYPTEQGHGVY
jgi:hypothetical protein